MYSNTLTRPLRIYDTQVHQYAVRFQSFGGFTAHVFVLPVVPTLSSFRLPFMRYLTLYFQSWAKFGSIGSISMFRHQGSIHTNMKPWVNHITRLRCACRLSPYAPHTLQPTAASFVIRRLWAFTFNIFGRFLFTYKADKASKQNV